MKQPSRKRASASARTSSSNGERNGAPKASDEQIRARAYDIYLSRGGAPGSEMEDWLQAERELTIEPVAADGPAGKPSRSARAPRTAHPQQHPSTEQRAE